MSSSASGVINLLDLPDEILIKIILHFNARERLTLANSCERFNNLVFGDKELLRNLDFTREWQLTTDADIQQYFNDEKTYKKIRRINTENVWAVNDLRASIGKAINLVELNILSGMRFGSVEELCSFLDPLVHLKRLSLNWPNVKMDGDFDIPIHTIVLEKPFSRLTYLSVELSWYSKEFLLILHLCQQLEELRMVISREVIRYVTLREEPMKLRNLKAVRFFCQGNPGPLKNDLMGMVEDPAEWTDFHLVDQSYEGYLERNVEVCKELQRVKEMPLPEAYAYCHDPCMFDMDCHLIPESLLTEVIRVTHEDAPEKFCCLSSSQCWNSQSCLLRIDEAKQLLKDPGYQISYLHLPHVIERNCDAHLLASAFPHLTTLILSRLSKSNSEKVPKENAPFRRRLRKKGSTAPEEHDDPTNPDSSFEMLIENTPDLKILMISTKDVSRMKNEAGFWDLDSLYLIPRWKNLTSIHLHDIPITDGKFLIDIGKECTKLEEIGLHRLGLSRSCDYETELLQMLQHCRNLKKFKIFQHNMENISELFSTLSNNSKLSSVRLDNAKASDSDELMSSVEKMLRQCSELTKFMIDISPYQVYDKLSSTVNRIVSELNRPDFQFNTAGPNFDYDNASNAFFASPLQPFPRYG